MLTAEVNQRLTRIGPGTPCGELLRRYWHPVALASEFTPESPLKQVKILGEELLVIRRADRTYACISEHCAHRNCSLRYGFLEDDGIRCAYHGWKYDFTGQCSEQPFEAPGSSFRKSVKLSGYPVKQLGGFLFAYMGPEPAPVLPRWDVIARRDGERHMTVRGPLSCNWLQTQENDVDSIHTHYLHAHTLISHGVSNPGLEMYHSPIVGYDWEVCDLGILKHIKYGGNHPGVEHRPPLIFPNILRIGNTRGLEDDDSSGGGADSMHWRVPVDDEHTLIFQESFRHVDGMDVDPDVVQPEVSYFVTAQSSDGLYDMFPAGGRSEQAFANQDRMAWETQGPIVDRTRERLAATDRGIVIYRKMLADEIDVVEAGGNPRGLSWNRDDDKMISLESTLFVPAPV